MRAPFLSLCLLGSLAVSASAASPEEAGTEFFETKVRPVLVEHCYQCHSSGARKQKGGLSLDSSQGIRKGGASGPAVVPGSPQQSLLLKAVSYTDDELRMPPKGKLPAAVIADLRHWIESGASDPRAKDAAATATAAWADVLRNRRQWWSLQPVQKPALPPVRDAGWSRQPVDRFILARLEQAGLAPAEPADRRTLVRRLSLVLTGLPPTPAEVDAFVGDSSPLAVEKLVDRLLASPHFGERWARHWLDVVRYAETHGFEWNYEVHHAWRYRDYLIRAFNQDVPYDVLVREHIAGDLLSAPRWNRLEQFNESAIGTAFFRFGEVGHDDCIEFREIGLDALDNQIDTLSKAFQATTVACARCHDHKLDAVSMRDYYALLAILRSSRQVSHTIDAPEVNDGFRRRLHALKAQIQQELAGHWLAEARDTGKYLLAAQAARDSRSEAPELAKGLDRSRLEKWTAMLQAAKPNLEDPLRPWLSLQSGASQDRATWRALAGRYEQESGQRVEFNARNFVPFGDFRTGRLDGWQADGQGLRAGPVRSGDFNLAGEGDRAVAGVLPAGLFTHALSDRLNGALRSPNLPRGRKYVSLQVLGGLGGAARLVTNSCQLNYRNFKYLKTDALTWEKFSISADPPGLSQYVELMTRLDNPKFPDQLGSLGGGDNARVPYEQAVADPRSFFGIARAVLHDCAESPRDELTHLRRLFAGSEPASAVDLAARYAAVVADAVKAWAEGRAADDDVRWLDWLLRNGLVGNSAKLTPRLAALVAEYRATEKRLQTPRVVPGLADGEPLDQPVYVRGDYRKPGEAVPRRYLEVLSDAQEGFSARGSGRLELAERIASPRNPLTARVLVNRIWHHLFGTGLVRTTDDFGHLGDRPSHPELLDYLAARFVEEGWSIKRLIRMLVLSRTFQMSNHSSAAAAQVDPRNRLLHHYPARRMEAEAIRDSILAASGRLERRLYGFSVQPFREKANPDRRLFPGPLDGGGRRSIYIKPTLMEGPKFLTVFNFPGGKVAQGRRDVTNVPAQALALLNDPFVLQQADVWAGRLVARPDTSVSARIEHMFLVALGRPPEADEKERFATAVGQLTSLHGVSAEAVLGSREVWKNVAHALFNMQEFIYIR